MTARSKLAAEPLPAIVSDIALLYQSAYAISNDLDLAQDRTGGGRCVWNAVGELAAATMRLKPKDLGDVALQMGIAAGWMNLVGDHCEKDSLAESIANAAEMLIANTLFYLAEMDELPIEGAPLYLLNKLLEEPRRNYPKAAEVLS